VVASIYGDGRIHITAEVSRRANTSDLWKLNRKETILAHSSLPPSNPMQPSNPSLHPSPWMRPSGC
jgi:hypothetical protein